VAEPGTWISVGALAEAFRPGSYAPEPSPALEGRELRVSLEDGRVVWYRFFSGGRLNWKVIAGPQAGQEGVEAVKVFAAREGLYLIDYVKADEVTTSVSLVADLASGAGTMVIGRLPGGELVGSLAERIAMGAELTPVSAQFLSASLDKPLTVDTLRHLPTKDLVGKRVLYTYSPTERYEHIYLNERLYTWHCLEGVEKGLADTDRCHYYKLQDQLYLFVWREKIVPTLGLVVLDLERMRTVGKIFGYQSLTAGQRSPDGREGASPVNFAVGARARLLNVTSYAEDV